MLTGCFPFRRQEDEGLEVQAVLQKMLPRILKADYQKPKVLCPENFAQILFCTLDVCTLHVGTLHVCTIVQNIALAKLIVQT